MFLTFKLFVADLRTIFRKQPNPYIVVLGPSVQKTRAIVRIVMQAVISLVVLGASLYVIIEPCQPGALKKPAFAGIGAIVGYWLR